MQELTIVVPEAALVEAKRGNYIITAPTGAQRELKRNEDFGNPVNPKTGKPVFPQPILYKGGAEKIIRDYKMFDRYIVQSHSDPENGYFYYEVKCQIVAYNPQTGQEIVYTEGVGCANTRESKTGTQSGFDGANSALKKAKKRAMVDAAISLAGLSSIFTQDLENENFMNSAYEVVQAKDDDPITSKQRQRIFAIAAQQGLSNEQTKQWITAKGFASVKDIRQKDYDAICNELEGMNSAR